MGGKLFHINSTLAINPKYCMGKINWTSCTSRLFVVCILMSKPLEHHSYDGRSWIRKRDNNLLLDNNALPVLSIPSPPPRRRNNHGKMMWTNQLLAAAGYFVIWSKQQIIAAKHTLQFQFRADDQFRSFSKFGSVNLMGYCIKVKTTTF